MMACQIARPLTFFGVDLVVRLCWVFSRSIGKAFMGLRYAKFFKALSLANLLIAGLLGFCGLVRLTPQRQLRDESNRIRVSVTLPSWRRIQR